MLTELVRKERSSTFSTYAHYMGWIALIALVISTGVHAVSLVVEQIGFHNNVMSFIRVLSPVLVEVIAAVVAVGFASHAWKAKQKPIGVGIELLWLGFAGLNLITSFTLESGGPLPSTLDYWLRYGLPLSALVTGAMFYLLLRLDPEHQRAEARQIAQTNHEDTAFKMELEVLGSQQMNYVLQQRGWLRVIEGLEREGYTDEQIAFMIQDVPNLQIRNLPKPPTLATRTNRELTRPEEKPDFLAGTAAKKNSV